MEVFIIGLHITLCFFLILVVLLQPGKGADFGAAMGGASQEAFGAAGSVTLLTKITGVIAAMFMLTSLSLAWYSNVGEGSGELSPEAMERAASGGMDSSGAEEDEAAPEAPEGTEDSAAAPGSTEQPPVPEGAEAGSSAPPSEGAGEPAEPSGTDGEPASEPGNSEP